MTRRRNRTAWLAMALAIGSASPAPATEEDHWAAERALFRNAWNALGHGRPAEAMAVLPRLGDYPLAPYIEFEYLRQRLHRVAPARVRRFLEANAGTAPGERLRRQWILHLGRRGQWQSLLRDYRPDLGVEAQCLQLRARLATGRPRGVDDEALALWMAGESRPRACDPLFTRLYRNARITDAHLWQRLRLAMHSGATRLARYLAGRLGARLAPLGRAWLVAARRPSRLLADGHLPGDSAEAREVVGWALARLARRDVQAALQRWRALAPRFAFDAEQQAAIERTLAVAAAWQDHAEAGNLLDALPPLAIDGRTQGAMLRHAVATHDWARLREWTRRPAAEGMNPLRWRYWRARAMERTGDGGAARERYAELAEARDYYGFLAAERLGRPHHMLDRPLSVDPAVAAGVALRPDVTRALEAHRVGLDYHARREWRHALARLSPQEQLAAALLASDAGWHDRAIATVAVAGHLDDLALRFPMPWREAIERAASDAAVPVPLVFGIIRAESAFLPEARSAAGALGLMQLMPATGRHVAHRLGVALPRARALLQPALNLKLGTAYLAEVLAAHGGNVPMALAAYNAGPHRVRHWQPEHGCREAEEWIELIPFRETRRYVRRVMYYAAVYQWRLEHERYRLQPLMAGVPSGDRAADELAC